MADSGRPSFAIAAIRLSSRDRFNDSSDLRCWEWRVVEPVPRKELLGDDIYGAPLSDEVSGQPGGGSVSLASSDSLE